MRRPFVAGLTWTLLGWATINALSFFYYSRGWGNLLGTRQECFEAIGVPWVVWRYGHAYGYPSALAGDAMVGLILAMLVGWVAEKAAPRRPRASEQASRRSAEPTNGGLRPWQFSLRALFVSVTVVAIAMAAVRSVGAVLPVVLGTVYFLGPALIVWLWFQLRHLETRYRSGAVIAFATILMAISAVSAQMMPTIDDFTKGILGIYVFWTPQCMLAAAVAAARRGMLRAVRGRSSGAKQAAARPAETARR